MPEVRNSISPDSQWDFNTTNEGNDQVGTVDMTEWGTVTFSDTGGKFTGEGYADMGFDDNSWLRDQNQAADNMGIEANQAFTYIAFMYFPTTLDGLHTQLRIQGNTNSHFIEMGVNDVDTIDVGRRSKTSSSGGSNFDVTSISADTWYLIALGHDPSTNEVFFWWDETEYRISDLGDHDYSEANSDIFIGGNGFTNSSADAYYSHGRLYVGFVPTLSDIQDFKADGEFYQGVLSDTAIQTTSETTKTSDADILIQIVDITKTSDATIGGTTQISKLSDSLIKVSGENTVVSDTRVLALQEVTKLSNADIKVLGTETTQISNARVLVTQKLEVINPDHQWDYNSTNQGTDQIGSEDFTNQNNPVFSDSGGKFTGEGYVYSSNHNAYLDNQSFGTVADGDAFTYLGFYWFDVDEWEDTNIPIRIEYPSSQYFYLRTNPTVSELRADINSDDKLEFTTVNESVPIGQWVLLALVGNPSGNLVTVWVDNVSQNFSGHGNFGASSKLFTKGNGFDGAIHGRVSHQRFYLNFVPTQSDIENFMDVGEFGNNYLSDARVKRGSTVDVLSDTSIQIIQESSLLSDARISTINAIEKISEAKIILEPTLSPFSDARIRKTLSTTTSSDTGILLTSANEVDSFSSVFIIASVQKPSDTAVLQRIDASMLSDSRVLVTSELSVTSNTTIKNLGREVSPLSDTNVKVLDNEVQISSRAAVKRLADYEGHIRKFTTSKIMGRYEASLIATTAVQTTGETIVTSDTLVVIAVTVDGLSDARVLSTRKVIRRAATRVFQRNSFVSLSDSRVQTVGFYNRVQKVSDASIFKIITREVMLLSDSRVSEESSFQRPSSSAVLTTSELALASDANIKLRRGNITGIMRKAVQ